MTHITRKAGILAGAAAAALIAAGALSGAAAEVKEGSFSGVDTLTLEDFVATVTVIVDDVDAVSVTIDDRNGGKEPVLFSQSGSTLRIYSNDAPDHNTFWRNLNWQMNGDQAFRKFLSDYPLVTVTIPAGTDITVDDLAAYVTIGNTNAALDINSTVYLEGSVGDLDSADINISGAGDLVLAAVATEMTGRISGSGSLLFDAVGSADISIAGSGDVNVKSVAGDAEVDIRGSGDVWLGPVGGDADFDIAGSGDIESGAVEGGLHVAIRGSGDIEVASINGPTDIDINGNGDVSINGGNAEDMKVSISGSGDLDFAGIASNPSVSVHGSGDIFIKDYTGKVSTSGSGDIVIGNIVIDD